MKNPLNRRFLRELRGDFGKYLVIFILLVGSIGFVSGYLVADASMITAYDESFEKYNMEDGNFVLEKKANKYLKEEIESQGVTLYENYYVEEPLTNGSTMRIFRERKEVNLPCIMDGELPDTANEIAVDRMYADNNKIGVGDTLTVQIIKRDGTVKEGKTYTISGLVALPDYSALFSDNSDMMFDAMMFGVGVVTEGAFAEFDKSKLVYDYIWQYNDTSSREMDNRTEQDVTENLMKFINSRASLRKFVPQFQNQAIIFTGDDLGSDKVMVIVLLYIIIVIMAFVFAVTTSNTITKEANVIGTLRASGYTKSELIRHYMTMPVIVTLISAVIGNILGYTYFKEVTVLLYYNSYSLPTYETVWSAEAFYLTTLVPILVMIIVNYVMLKRKLSLSPLKFIRRDLTRRKNRRAIWLPEFIPFMHRYRTRIFFQNLSSYMVLFLGILFANLLLIFGMGLPRVLDIYTKSIGDNMFAPYQYMLEIPMEAMDEENKLGSLVNMMMFERAVETKEETAEKFTVYSLKTTYENYPEDTVMIYGVEKNSRYIDVDLGDENAVYVSSAYADKYGTKVGEPLTFKETYEEDTYNFRVAGVYDYMGALAVFMDRTALNRMLDNDDDYFAGYFSENPINDIKDEYIGSVIDFDALNKTSRQLMISMGGMMGMVNAFAMVIFTVLLYLLGKIIIEKNAQSISISKILGYSNPEISGLYIVTTSVVVVLLLLITLPIESFILIRIFRIMIIQMMSGWMPLVIERRTFVQAFLMGVGVYAVVAVFEYWKVRKVPMGEALKNIE